MEKLVELSSIRNLHNSNLSSFNMQKANNIKNQAFLRKLNETRNNFEKSEKTASELLGITKPKPIPKPRVISPKPKPRTLIPDLKTSVNDSKIVITDQPDFTKQSLTKIPTATENVYSKFESKIHHKPVNKQQKSGGLSALLTKDLMRTRNHMDNSFANVQNKKQLSVDSLPTICTTSYDFTQNAPSQYKPSIDSLESIEMARETKLWFDTAILKVEKDNRITKWLEKVDNEVFD